MRKSVFACIAALLWSSVATGQTQPLRLNIGAFYACGASSDGVELVALDPVDDSDCTTGSGSAQPHSCWCDGGASTWRTSGLGSHAASLDLDMGTNVVLFDDGSQAWEVGGDSTSFFVEDVTAGGSALPFRVRPGAPTSSVDVAADGDVGIGTSSPGNRMHVVGGNNPRVIIEDNVDDANDKPGFVLRSPSAASSGDWLFEIDNSGNFQIDFGPSSGPEIRLSDTTSGNSEVTIAGNVKINSKLGIGGTAPTNDLEVKRDGANVIVLVQNTNAISKDAGINFQNTVSSWTARVKSSSGEFIVALVAGNNVIRLDPGADNDLLLLGVNASDEVAVTGHVTATDYVEANGAIWYGPRSSAPTSPTPTDGSFYFDTTSNALRVFYSSAWHSLAEV